MSAPPRGRASGVPADKGAFMALINEITKAWYYPEYWAYVSICREMDMEPKPPASEGIYNRTHIAEYIRRADYEYGLRNRTR